jgi:hypothetical protein
MQELFKGTKYSPGHRLQGRRPNVVPIGMAILMDPETIWIGNQFFLRP